MGTKYDTFASFPKQEQEEITMQARRFAKAMKAPLIFCSTSHSINVNYFLFIEIIIYCLHINLYHGFLIKLGTKDF